MYALSVAVAERECLRQWPSAPPPSPHCAPIATRAQEEQQLLHVEQESSKQELAMVVVASAAPLSVPVLAWDPVHTWMLVHVHPRTLLSDANLQRISSPTCTSPPSLTIDPSSSPTSPGAHSGVRTPSRVLLGFFHTKHDAKCALHALPSSFESQLQEEEDEDTYFANQGFIKRITQEDVPYLAAYTVVDCLIPRA